MYYSFNLVLMVNHACNLRCTYCYTGTKFSRTMSAHIGKKAIDRSISSLAPGGTLELGFFGGEPLLESDLVLFFIEHARASTQGFGMNLQLSITSNGTLCSEEAWKVMMLPDLDLAISHDGTPQIHDRHRRYVDGRSSSAQAEATLRKLLEAGKEVRVVIVARPDNLESLSDGIEYLYAMGVRQIELSLDLWTKWKTEDGPRLETAVLRCAHLWRALLPNLELNWFTEKAARLAGIPLTETARCGFGDGQIAVAPSGNLYPCERLIGEDASTNSMRLPGHTLEGLDFLHLPTAAKHSAEECKKCELQALCGTTCCCSNYVRTGKTGEPDGLLCLLEQVCLSATAHALNGPKARDAKSINGGKLS